MLSYENRLKLSPSLCLKTIPQRVAFLALVSRELAHGLSCSKFLYFRFSLKVKVRMYSMVLVNSVIIWCY